MLDVCGSPPHAPDMLTTMILTDLIPRDLYINGGESGYCALADQPLQGRL